MALYLDVLLLDSWLFSLVWELQPGLSSIKWTFHISIWCGYYPTAVGNFVASLAFGKASRHYPPLAIYEAFYESLTPLFYIFRVEWKFESFYFFDFVASLWSSSLFVLISFDSLLRSVCTHIIVDLCADVVIRGFFFSIWVST